MLNIKSSIDNGVLSISYDMYKPTIAGGIIEPVSDYYMIVVKSKHRSTFSLASAELLFIEGDIYKITPDNILGWGGERYTKLFNVISIFDSDGDVIDGECVVFIFATLDINYKMYINNFEDLLSDPEYIT